MSKKTSVLNSRSDEELFQMMKEAQLNPERAKLAWNEFFSRYAPYIWNCCLKICRSITNGDEIAKDIFQASMEKIFIKASTFKPEKNTGIKAWMGRVAQNEFNDYLKKYYVRFTSYGEEHPEPEYEEYDENEEEKLAGIIQEMKQHQLEQLLGRLNAKEIKILMTYMSFFQMDNPHTHLPDAEMEKLCKEFNVKSDAIRQIKKRALDKRKAFVKEMNNA